MRCSGIQSYACWQAESVRDEQAICECYEGGTGVRCGWRWGCRYAGWTPSTCFSETHKTKPKRSGDWNYNQIRSSFISAFRKETKCDYATAKSQWDLSETKKSILGPLSLPELKRRKFVGKTCEKNPWAWISLEWCCGIFMMPKRFQYLYIVARRGGVLDHGLTESLWK